MTMFIHYGPSTYARTGHGWEDNPVVPDSINPSSWDPGQWARVAKETGFKGLIFVAKHHNGFSLWPTATSEFDIASTPFKGGNGDMVADVAEAVRAEGLKLGLYLSPWDKHEPTYGTDAYRELYLAQIEELMTDYGPVFELWFDAARAEGVPFDFIRLDDAARFAYTLQPDVMVGPLGPPPDFRWGGNESGIAEETTWMRRPGYWQPPECDFPMRRSWFWTPADDGQVLTVDELVNAYFTTQGRSCQFLLGLSPDDRGLLPEADVQRLRDFRTRLDRMFATDLAAYKATTASDVRDDAPGWAGRQATDPRAGTFWATNDGTTEASLTVDFDDPQSFDVVELREPIMHGQRIARHRLDAWNGTEWIPLLSSTTVGYRRLHRIERITTTRVRLVIEESLASPALSQFSLYDAGSN